MVFLPCRRQRYSVTSIWGGAIVAGTEQKPSERDRPVFGCTRRDFRHCGAPSDMVRAGKSERLLRIIRESRVMMWEQYRQRGCRNGKTGRHARSVNIRGQYGDNRRSRVQRGQN